MKFKSSYQAKLVDEKGFVHYTDQEHNIWQQLYERQLKILPGRACDEHIHGLDLLGLTNDKIPQIPDINKRLKAITGWTVSPVEALISHKDFFSLLASKVFPVATFIRSQEELNYVKEPDIFHEIFGHCPMLTQMDFANFAQKYAEKVLTMPTSDWALMQRLFWFTVEFGLIQTTDGIRAYGGGILSSIGETTYSVDSNEPLRVLYDPMTVMRTPYRIDQMQPIYFVIESYEQLYNLMQQEIAPILEQTRKLGELPAFFKVETNNPSVHVNAC